ncbi:hypothetical protein [Beggiatoa leptomitoformis]|uniref:Uncharacterized protein n=1 Tax=Beggiatoa leptomitoformis TaxID=288004 RepID=A0A2N9YGZ8_9GAMM|nr:hypothetical protein [Beggiatoa leptomitoformis]ALG68209.1 hypothetical protein AL038_11425 [Beggiatoa leptomitoformis]AUI69486.1 hypothetical protein BLE401_12845 [Beggiatoa leptomitoformis]
MKYYIKKFILYGFILFIAYLTLAYLMLHKDYAYKQAQQNYSNGQVSVTFLGHDTYSAHERKRGSPYKLLLSIEQNMTTDYLVILKTVILRKMYSKEVSFENKQEILKTPTTEYNKTYPTYFSFKGLYLEYTPYVLYLEFSVKIGENTQMEKVEIPIYPNYQEYYSNTLLDMIMSV